MPAHINIFAAEARRCVPFIRRGIVQTLRLLRSPITDLSIAILPAPQMAQLHQTHLHISGPTDVLTFELDHDSRHRVTAGEIVICSTVARNQSMRLHHPLSHELLLYAVHGVLHLSAFDDRTAPAFQAMHAKEDHILTQLGIGNVFARGSR